MEQRSRVPNPLALCVLGLLHERPMHPYEIAFEMRARHLADHIKLSFGSLYHAVESLERAGWIEPVSTTRSGGRPERTVYRLTEGGDAAFEGRLRQLLAEPVREYSAFEAGLAFVGRLDRAVAVALLAERRNRLAGILREKQEVLSRVVREGLPRLWVIEREHALAGVQAELNWLSQVIEDIESGELEWRRVNDAGDRVHACSGEGGNP